MISNHANHYHYTFPSEPMKTRSQGDMSSDDFIIDRPRMKHIIQSKPKSISHAVKSMANTHKLQRAADAPGQKKVSNYYFINQADVHNENYLPDWARNQSQPTPVCIVISSDDSYESLKGPDHVLMPSSDTKVFEYPNLSPVLSDDDECIVIADTE